MVHALLAWLRRVVSPVNVGGVVAGQPVEPHSETARDVVFSRDVEVMKGQARRHVLDEIRRRPSREDRVVAAFDPSARENEV